MHKRPQKRQTESKKQDAGKKSTEIAHERVNGSVRSGPRQNDSEVILVLDSSDSDGNGDGSIVSCGLPCRFQGEHHKQSSTELAIREGHATISKPSKTTHSPFPSTSRNSLNTKAKGVEAEHAMGETEAHSSEKSFFKRKRHTGNLQLVSGTDKKHSSRVLKHTKPSTSPGIGTPRVFSSILPTYLPLKPIPRKKGLSAPLASAASSKTGLPAPITSREIATNHASTQVVHEPKHSKAVVTDHTEKEEQGNQEYVIIDEFSAEPSSSPYSETTSLDEPHSLSSPEGRTFPLVGGKSSLHGRTQRKEQAGLLSSPERYAFSILEDGSSSRELVQRYGCNRREDRYHRRRRGHLTRHTLHSQRRKRKFVSLVSDSDSSSAGSKRVSSPALHGLHSQQWLPNTVASMVSTSECSLTNEEKSTSNGECSALVQKSAETATITVHQSDQQSSNSMNMKDAAKDDFATMNGHSLNSSLFPLSSSPSLSPTAPVSTSSGGTPMTTSGSEAPVTISVRETQVTASGSEAPVTVSVRETQVTTSGSEAPVIISGRDISVAVSGGDTPVTASGGKAPMIASVSGTSVTTGSETTATTYGGSMTPVSTFGSKILSGCDKNTAPGMDMVEGSLSSGHPSFAVAAMSCSPPVPAAISRPKQVAKKSTGGISRKGNIFHPYGKLGGRFVPMRRSELSIQKVLQGVTKKPEPVTKQNSCIRSVQSTCLCEPNARDERGECKSIVNEASTSPSASSQTVSSSQPVSEGAEFVQGNRTVELRTEKAAVASPSVEHYVYKVSKNKEGGRRVLGKRPRSQTGSHIRHDLLSAKVSRLAPPSVADFPHLPDDGFLSLEMDHPPVMVCARIRPYPEDKVTQENTMHNPSPVLSKTVPSVGGVKESELEPDIDVVNVNDSYEDISSHQAGMDAEMSSGAAMDSQEVVEKQKGSEEVWKPQEAAIEDETGSIVASESKDTAMEANVDLDATSETQAAVLDKEIGSDAALESHEAFLGKQADLDVALLAKEVGLDVSFQSEEALLGRETGLDGQLESQDAVMEEEMGSDIAMESHEALLEEDVGSNEALQSLHGAEHSTQEDGTVLCSKMNESDINALNSPLQPVTSSEPLQGVEVKEAEASLHESLMSTQGEDEDDIVDIEGTDITCHHLHLQSVTGKDSPHQTSFSDIQEQQDLERPFSSPDLEYDMRLLHTIAQLSGTADQPDPIRLPHVNSLLNEDGSERVDENDLVVHIELSNLYPELMTQRSRSPSLPSSISQRSCSPSLPLSVRQRSHSPSLPLSVTRHSHSPPLPSSPPTSSTIYQPSLVSTTLGTYVSAGVQVESGMVIDQEVLDSYLSLKMEEQLFDLREHLREMEKQVSQTLSERDRVEETLREKVQLIKRLTQTGFESSKVDSCTMTDPLDCGNANMQARRESSSQSTVSASVSTQSMGIMRAHPLFLGHPTHGFTDTTSLCCLMEHSSSDHERYLQLGRHTMHDAHMQDSQETSDISHWLVSDSYCLSHCSRCTEVNARTKFLHSCRREQAARKKAGVCRQPHGEGISSEDIPSEEADEHSWAQFSPPVRHHLERLARTLFLLKELPLEEIVSGALVRLIDCLDHLVQHLPECDRHLAPSVHDLRRYQTPGVGMWILGDRLATLAMTLEQLITNESFALPAYFRAELSQLLHVTRETINYLTQDMRHATIMHTPDETVASPLALNPPRSSSVGKSNLEDSELDLVDWSDSSSDDDDSGSEMMDSSASQSSLEASTLPLSLFSSLTSPVPVRYDAHTKHRMRLGLLKMTTMKLLRKIAMLEATSPSSPSSPRRLPRLSTHSSSVSPCGSSVATVHSPVTSHKGSISPRVGMSVAHTSSVSMSDTLPKKASSSSPTLFSSRRTAGHSITSSIPHGAVRLPSVTSMKKAKVSSSALVRPVAVSTSSASMSDKFPKKASSPLPQTISSQPPTGPPKVTSSIGRPPTVTSVQKSKVFSSTLDSTVRPPTSVQRTMVSSSTLDSTVRLPVVTSVQQTVGSGKDTRESETMFTGKQLSTNRMARVSDLLERIGTIDAQTSLVSSPTLQTVSSNFQSGSVPLILSNSHRIQHIARQAFRSSVTRSLSSQSSFSDKNVPRGVASTVPSEGAKFIWTGQMSVAPGSVPDSQTSPKATASLLVRQQAVHLSSSDVTQLAVSAIASESKTKPVASGQSTIMSSTAKESAMTSGQTGSTASAYSNQQAKRSLSQQLPSTAQSFTANQAISLTSASKISGPIAISASLPFKSITPTTENQVISEASTPIQTVVRMVTPFQAIPFVSCATTTASLHANSSDRSPPKSNIVIAASFNGASTQSMTSSSSTVTSTVTASTLSTVVHVRSVQPASTSSTQPSTSSSCSFRAPAHSIQPASTSSTQLSTSTFKAPVWTPSISSPSSSTVTSILPASTSVIAKPIVHTRSIQLASTQLSTPASNVPPSTCSVVNGETRMPLLSSTSSTTTSILPASTSVIAEPIVHARSVQLASTATSILPASTSVIAEPIVHARSVQLASTSSTRLSGSSSISSKTLLSTRSAPLHLVSNSLQPHLSPHATPSQCRSSQCSVIHQTPSSQPFASRSLVTGSSTSCSSCTNSSISTTMIPTSTAVMDAMFQVAHHGKSTLPLQANSSIECNIIREVNTMGGPTAPWQINTLSHLNRAAAHSSLPPVQPVQPIPGIAMPTAVPRPYPPVPKLVAMNTPRGIVVRWTFSSDELFYQSLVHHYVLCAHVRNPKAFLPPVSEWGKVGNIKPMRLPMAVTLTNFVSGQMYYFVVQAHFCDGRISSSIYGCVSL